MTNASVRARLQSLCSLRREITRTKKRIAVLESRIGGETDKALICACKHTKEMLCDYLKSAEREAGILLCYISAIEDTHVRELFMLRYIDGVRSWQRVAFLAGEHDESYVRRKHNAYLKSHPQIQDDFCGD